MLVFEAGAGAAVSAAPPEGSAKFPYSRGVTIMKILSNWKALAMLLAFGAMAGCATAPSVSVRQDDAADFSRFQTFGFLEPLGTDRQGYQTIVSQTLRQAALREMLVRGFRYDPQAPQLLINFGADLNDRMRVNTATRPTSASMHRSAFNHRGSFYSPWPMYTQTTTVTQYQEGAIRIDVVDAGRRQLVWESVVSSRMTNELRNDVPAALNEAVNLAFARFPVAGQALPK
jgi:hypothetical protein